MGSPQAAEQKRIQFDLLPERLSAFDQLMVFCDLKTRKELFDNAMTLFEWAVHEVMNGSEIASYNRKTDHVEVVRLPVLENAARRAKNLKVVHVEELRESDPPQAESAKVTNLRSSTAASENARAVASQVPLKEVEC
jgi:hypothetical protein